MTRDKALRRAVRLLKQAEQAESNSDARTLTDIARGWLDVAIMQPADTGPDVPPEAEQIQGLGAAESQVMYGAEHRGPELQHGHRDPFYDEGGRWAEQREHAGFGPRRDIIR